MGDAPELDDFWEDESCHEMGRLHVTWVNGA